MKFFKWIAKIVHQYEEFLDNFEENIWNIINKDKNIL